MHSILSYFVSICVMAVSVFITLFFKTELERMFKEKKEVAAFHLCNVVIILMMSFAAYAVTAIYLLGDEFEWAQQIMILMFIILPMYMTGYVIVEKYKSLNRKYVAAENGKVLIINEKYLNRR